MYYVRIDGIDDDLLGFLGYTVVAEDSEFKLYKDYHGDEHVVEKSRPFLYVDDPNDAAALSRRAKVGQMVEPPPGH